MKKIITTTTILPPTKAIRTYDAMPDWELVVVGDSKTPEYRLDRGTYLDWKYQQDQYPDLCSLIGPCSVERGRMISFIEAFKRGADIVAVIDDDNYPYPFWGENVNVMQPVEVDWYESDKIACDPIDRFFNGSFWHRGFPIQLVRDKSKAYWPAGTRVMTPLVQADLWDGDPDIDAIVRLAGYPNVKFPKIERPYAFNAYTPFDSQNTFIAGSVLKDHYANIPWTGRQSDIWASYIFEKLHPGSVIYSGASVYHAQQRSVESLMSDYWDEQDGCLRSLQFLYAIEEKGAEKACEGFLEPEALKAIELYRGYFV